MQKWFAMKIVIVGAGFAGLRLARLLSNHPVFEVTLLDQYNYHQFQPLFYQVATGGLDASNISFPLRKAFHNSKNVRIRMATVQAVDVQQQQVVTESEKFTYDYLVLATGATTNFFGNERIAIHAMPMKSTVEALQLRHELIHNFENALVAKDAQELQRLLNIVVVGGGATGVELSGAVAEMKKWVLPKDYPELDFSKMHIFLLEGGARLLAGMEPKSSRKSETYLRNLGVDVLLNTIVADYDGKEVSLQNGERIPAAMVIWAAGIKANVPEGIAPQLLTRGNRIMCDAYNRVQGYTNIFVLGDAAFMETKTYPCGHPQVAPVAIQQASLLAKNLMRLYSGKPLQTFHYKNKGAMATVGRHLAVVDVPKPRFQFGGLLAWLVWMSLHLMLILGVKNRFFVFTNWLYNYFTYDQSLRLIFRAFYRHPAGANDNVKA